MIDPGQIGTRLETVRVAVETGQLRLFAKATGQTNPIHFDLPAALAAGYRGIVAPPTFVFCLYALGRSDPLSLYRVLGVRLDRILHGEQKFGLSEVVICSGDTLDFSGAVVDIYSKKGGALDFLVQELVATNQLGEHVATCRSTIVVRN